MLDNFKFDNIVEAIGNISALIKKFADMLKAFVASWKKVPAAANGTDDAEPANP